MEKQCFFELTGETVEYNILHLKQLTFEVTDVCNLHCKYCGYAELYDKSDKRESKMLSFVKAKIVIDFLISKWTSIYSPDVFEPITISFYGGEPLLNINLIKQIINYLNKQQVEVSKRFVYIANPV